MDDLYEDIPLDELQVLIVDAARRLAQAESQAAVSGDSYTTDLAQLRRSLKEMRYSRDLRTGRRQPANRIRSTQVFALNDYWER